MAPWGGLTRCRPRGAAEHSSATPSCPKRTLPRIRESSRAAGDCWAQALGRGLTGPCGFVGRDGGRLVLGSGLRLASWVVRAGAEPAGGAGGSPSQPPVLTLHPVAGAAPSLRSSLPPGPQVVNSWPLGGSGQAWLDLRCPPWAPAPAPPIPPGLLHPSAHDALGLPGLGLLRHLVGVEQMSVRRLGGRSRARRLPLKPRAWWRSPTQAITGAGPSCPGRARPPASP